MKHTAIIITILALHLPLCVEGAEAQRTLVTDAAALSSTKGIPWKSGVLKLKMQDGSVSERVLVVEFAPNTSTDQSNPPHADRKSVV